MCYIKAPAGQYPEFPVETASKGGAESSFTFCSAFIKSMKKYDTCYPLLRNLIAGRTVNLIPFFSGELDVAGTADIF